MATNPFRPRALDGHANSSFAVPAGAVTVIASVQALGGREQELAAVSAALVPAVRTGEPGNLVFEAHKGANAAGLVVFYEVFRDQAAFEAHKQAPHTQQWFQAIAGLAATPVRVDVLDNLDRYDAAPTSSDPNS